MKLQILAFIVGVALSANSHATVTPPYTGAKEGGAVYRTCYYCHSLIPGVHLTGPSLANLWGKKAGQVKDFERYSDALKKADIIWNEVTLKSFLTHPHVTVPGTTMPFDGIKNEVSVDGMVDFLKLAMGPGGHKKAQKYVVEETANGQLPKDLSKADKKDLVREVVRCGTTYTVTTADDKTAQYWELNLSFRVNSGDRGPLENKPVRLSTGSMGDRFIIVFRNFTEIAKTVKECKTPGL